MNNVTVISWYIQYTVHNIQYTTVIVLQVEYFEVDETERVNVWRQKFSFAEMRKSETVMESRKIKSGGAGLSDEVCARRRREHADKGGGCCVIMHDDQPGIEFSAQKSLFRLVMRAFLNPAKIAVCLSYIRLLDPRLLQGFCTVHSFCVQYMFVSNKEINNNIANPDMFVVVTV